MGDVANFEEAGGAPSRSSLAVLYAVLAILAAATAYIAVQLETMRRDMAFARQMAAAEVAKVRQAASLLDSASQRNIEALRSQVEEARRAAAAAAGQAKVEAALYAERLARELEDAQKRQSEQVAGEVSSVKEAASAMTGRISEVSAEVASVRSEAAAAKSELEKTIAELKSVRGDLGVQSGLVATNARELAALKALGDRDYYEFRIGKSKAPQVVGEISIRLKKTDVKRNRYTIEVIANNRLVEKKDRTLNEPLQFYMTRFRTPCEIVVNEIGKDLIAGYLATPKAQAGR